MAAAQSPCPSLSDMVSPQPTGGPAGCLAVPSSPAPVGPGEIVFGTSADVETGVVTDLGGPFVVGTPVAYLAWLDPALTFPTVRIIGTLDGVPWFDIPSPIDTAVNGPLPYTKEVGTLPPEAVAWPGTLRLQIVDAARVQLAEGTLVIVAQP